MKFVVNKRLAGKTPKIIIKLAEEICAEHSDEDGERVHVWLYDAVTLKVGSKFVFGVFFDLVNRARIAIATQRPGGVLSPDHPAYFAEVLYHEIAHAKAWSAGRKMSERNAERFAMRHTSKRFPNYLSALRRK